MAAGTPAILALYDALDTERQARGLSWTQLTREIGRISSTTVTGMRSRRVLEGDGVLQMLLWLHRSAESFDARAAMQPAFVAPPPMTRLQILRFDTRGLFAALDAERRSRGVSWQQVANEIGGIAPGGLTRFANGGRVGFPDVIRIAGWLGRPVSSLTHVSDW